MDNYLGLFFQEIALADPVSRFFSIRPKIGIYNQPSQEPRYQIEILNTAGSGSGVVKRIRINSSRELTRHQET
ncbi:hypothetical protein [Methylobacter svalbardensis]|uniref:hypothetical protein n=1 Tax=Methylobacter svalbardensis TaxID=3080016 RepID=UPI0030EC3C41